MRYTEACEFLFTLPRYAETGASAYQPGLTRMLSIMEAMGNPERSFQSVHIAGTNGKGSTASFLAAACTASGLRTGLHTSPHIFDFSERMRIDGKPVSEDWIISAVERYGSVFKEQHASFFEASTALCFLYFQERNVDLAIIEVGMGGRLDATNVIIPILSLITSISLDHTEQLGDTLEAIAAEKAGIIKTGVPVLTMNLHPGVKHVISAIASEFRAPFHDVLGEVSYEPVSEDMTGSTINARTSEREYLNLRIGLSGRYQIENALLAVRAAEILPVPLSEDAIRSGLDNVRHYSGLRGRFQILQRKPFIIADVAHNPAGLEVLLKHVKQHSSGTITAVFSTMRDKNVSEMARLFQRFNVATELLSLPVARSMPAEEVKTLFDPDYHSVRIARSVSESIHHFLDTAVADDVLLITGSHRIIEQIPPLYLHKANEKMARDS